MMQHHKGIVLKRYMPKKQKISVLDAQLGRIEAIIRDDRMLEMVWPGMEITYTLLSGIGVYLLDQVSLLEAPFASAREDITFLHHILELSYYFLELHDVTLEIFSLVQFACRASHSLTYEQKIMVVAKFLWQLRHEIEMLQESALLQRLLALPLESMLKEQVDVHVQAYLLSWVRHAILSHPQRGYFKTSGFIKEFESYEV